MWNHNAYGHFNVGKILLQPATAFVHHHRFNCKSGSNIIFHDFKKEYRCQSQQKHLIKRSTRYMALLTHTDERRMDGLKIGKLGIGTVLWCVSSPYTNVLPVILCEEKFSINCKSKHFYSGWSFVCPNKATRSRPTYKSWQNQSNAHTKWQINMTTGMQLGTLTNTIRLKILSLPQM